MDFCDLLYCSFFHRNTQKDPALQASAEFLMARKRNVEWQTKLKKLRASSCSNLHI